MPRDRACGYVVPAINYVEQEMLGQGANERADVCATGSRQAAQSFGSGCLGLLTVFIAFQVHFLAHRINGTLRTGPRQSRLCRRTVAQRHAL